MICTIFNQKGGTGKTTSAVNLAPMLARSRRVLLLDLDNQRNATGFFKPLETASCTIVDLFFGLQPLQKVAVHCPGRHGLSLWGVAGDSGMSASNPHFANRSNCELMLAKALQGALQSFDDIIIDCPGDWGVMAKNALLACTHHLMPIAPDQFSIDNAIDTEGRATLLYKDFERKGPELGVLLTNYRHTQGGQAIADQADQLWGKQVFETRIQYNAQFTNMTIEKKTVVDRKAVTGRDDFEALIQEMKTRKWL